jgi:hypothetical protein
MAKYSITNHLFLSSVFIHFPETETVNLSPLKGQIYPVKII